MYVFLNICTYGYIHTFPSRGDWCRVRSVGLGVEIEGDRIIIRTKGHPQGQEAGGFTQTHTRAVRA